MFVTVRVAGAVDISGSKLRPLRTRSASNGDTGLCCLGAAPNPGVDGDDEAVKGAGRTVAIRCVSGGFLRFTPDLAQYLLQRKNTLRMHQLQHAQFQMEPLLLPISQFIECAKHDLQKSRQLFF